MRSRSVCARCRSLLYPPSLHIWLTPSAPFASGWIGPEACQRLQLRRLQPRELDLPRVGARQDTWCSSIQRAATDTWRNSIQLTTGHAQQDGSSLVRRVVFSLYSATHTHAHLRTCARARSHTHPHTRTHTSRPLARQACRGVAQHPYAPQVHPALQRPASSHVSLGARHGLGRRRLPQLQPGWCGAVPTRGVIK
jgi:hypothetical protein